MHTNPVQKGLRYGMLLFIISEVMFFSSFFWAFFHSSLAPTIEIGSIWPPIDLDVFNPWDVPLLNTLILLLSGASITLAHYSLIKGYTKYCLFGFIYTIILAIIFTTLQYLEYCEASFVINDGVYGSLFYMLTGFHGFHVFVGTLFIIICLIRYLKGHFSSKHHFGFEAAIWYWHFVDVVWLFLFICVYWWGNYYYFLMLNNEI
jgi:heme/copper-type cytochrome/quinol oxidase subunit 3